MSAVKSTFLLRS